MKKRTIRRAKRVGTLLLTLVLALGTFALPAHAASVEDILFDSTYYAQHNSDVVRVLGSSKAALRGHYNQYGRREGRCPSDLFDPVWYLNAYSDLKAAFNNDYESAYRHFINHGIAEGRQGSPYFSVAVYKANYEDLRRTFGVAPSDNWEYLRHWVQYGRREGRNAVTLLSGAASSAAPSNALHSPIAAGAKFSKKTNDNGWYGYHDVNRNVSSNTPVYAITGGTAYFYQYNTNGRLRSYGNYVKFVSADGQYEVRYAHLSRFNGMAAPIAADTAYPCSGAADKGYVGSRSVSAGEVLGYVGTTGNSSGLHLHIEVYRNGARVDPAALFPALA